MGWFDDPERRKAEKAMREASAYLAEVVESAPMTHPRRTALANYFRSISSDAVTVGEVRRALEAVKAEFELERPPSVQPIP